MAIKLKVSRTAKPLFESQIGALLALATVEDGAAVCVYTFPDDDKQRLLKLAELILPDAAKDGRTGRVLARVKSELLEAGGAVAVDPAPASLASAPAPEAASPLPQSQVVAEVVVEPRASAEPVAAMVVAPSGPIEFRLPPEEERAAAQLRALYYRLKGES